MNMDNKISVFVIFLLHKTITPFGKNILICFSYNGESMRLWSKN